MTANSPEVIYLIDTGDGVAWCDDPDPTGDGECDDAVKYVRGDAYESLQAECEKLVEALERMIEDVERATHIEFGGTPWLKEKMAEIDYARDALAAYRQGGGE